MPNTFSSSNSTFYAGSVIGLVTMETRVNLVTNARCLLSRHEYKGRRLGANVLFSVTRT